MSTQSSKSNLAAKGLLALVAAGLVGLAACASLGTPEDQSESAALWRKMEGHRDWAFFEGWEGIVKGKGPHGKYVATYINSVAAANPDAPGFGSILVKENYGRKDVNSLESFTVMERIEGYDPENGDWFWARYDPKGGLTHAGKVAMCFDCHFDADGDDFVFLND